MKAARQNLVAILWAVLALSAPAWCQQRFPEWRARDTTLFTLWEATPIVLIGAVDKAVPWGVQPVDGLPYPVKVRVDKLFWCAGEMRIDAVIRGNLSTASRKFVWASVNPGCQLYDSGDMRHARKGAKVWFVREEDGMLRPTYDGGSKVLRFLVPWRQSPGLTPLEEFGSMLLTPTMIEPSLREYAPLVWELGDIACQAMGKPACVERLRQLAKMGNQELRQNACDFLRAQLQTSCVER